MSTSGAGTDVSIAGHTVTIAGVVHSVRDLTIMADNLSNTNVMTTGWDLNVASFTAGTLCH